VGPRAGLDALVKRKIPTSCTDSNPRSSTPVASAVPLSYPGSLGPYIPLSTVFSYAINLWVKDVVPYPSQTTGFSEDVGWIHVAQGMAL
jgi:hypothetical protein